MSFKILYVKSYLVIMSHTFGSAWYLMMWSMKFVPGYRSPPMATPSNTPSVAFEMILFNSLDIPPDRDTYATLNGEQIKQNYVALSTDLHCTLQRSISLIPFYEYRTTFI